jgi:hypothetical protein
MCINGTKETNKLSSYSPCFNKTTQKKIEVKSSNINKTKTKTRTQLQSCHPHTSKEQQNPQKKQSTCKLLLQPINKTTKIKVI